MIETLPAFLKKRAERSFRHLLAQIEGLTAAEALRDRDPRWPGQRWGIGQDGSIAGIVRHVAAWKQVSLPLFQPGGVALTQEELARTGLPDPDDWPGSAAWLTQVGTAWNARLAALPDSAFDEPRQFEEWAWPLWKFVVEWYEHDIQHASQIEYLRQRHAAGRA